MSEKNCPGLPSAINRHRDDQFHEGEVGGAFFHSRLPRLHGDEPRFAGHARHRSMIGRPTVLVPRDHYLNDQRCCWDWPAAARSSSAGCRRIGRRGCSAAQQDSPCRSSGRRSHQCSSVVSRRRRKPMATGVGFWRDGGCRSSCRCWEPGAVEAPPEPAKLLELLPARIAVIVPRRATALVSAPIAIQLRQHHQRGREEAGRHQGFGQREAGVSLTGVEACHRRFTRILFEASAAIFGNSHRADPATHAPPPRRSPSFIVEEDVRQNRDRDAGEIRGYCQRHHALR